MGFKVLWCDRNYDYVESFIEATREIIPEIEFVLKDEPVDAIKEILTNKNDYKLIISGQVFKNMNGTDFFEIIFNNKVQVPFLLLTAQVDCSQFAQYDLWYSFSYMDKLKSDFYEVAEKIKELINRDVAATYSLHKKLKDIRDLSGLSISQFAKSLGVSELEVTNSETDYKKISSTYLYKVAEYFDLELQLLIQSESSYLQQKLKERSLNQKKKHSNIG